MAFYRPLRYCMTSVYILLNFSVRTKCRGIHYQARSNQNRGVRQETTQNGTFVLDLHA